MKKLAIYFLVAAVLAIGGSSAYEKYWKSRQMFEISWDEEVRMTNGKSIVVHVKRTFARRSYTDPWLALDRDTEITFDSGPPRGVFRRNFQNYDVTMIENEGGNWYIGLQRTTGIPPKKWVTPQFPVLILKSDGSEVAASSWEDIPDFTQLNLMPVTPSPKGISKFANSRLTWDTKIDHWQRNQRAAGDTGLIFQRHVNKEENKK
jgi:hypothetical protein